jgi:hypothetical protein
MRGLLSLGGLGSLAGLFACTQTPEPTVQGSGGDNYTVRVRAAESTTGILLAQSAALDNARAFCAARGRRFLAMGSQVAEGGIASDLTYTVRFRCPEADSPELQRPTVNQAPDDLL